MARRNLDPRVTELHKMHRHSAPAIPAPTRTSSRPTSLILGPFVQPNFEGPGQHRMSRMQADDSHHPLEDDERPLTQIELDPPSKEEDVVDYPASWKLASITIALCMAIFLVALVRSRRFRTLLIQYANTPLIVNHRTQPSLQPLHPELLITSKSLKTVGNPSLWSEVVY